jgi:predicted DNA-binding transcriptional regulator YafY
MVQVQSTPVRTVTAQSGMILPATITPQTDFNVMETACIVYSRFNGHKVAYDTLDKVKDAMRDGSAVVTLYADAKGEIAARCLWPNSVTLSKENAITCKAYCTLRREWRSFRLDRMLACHELTTPDDCETAVQA